MQHCKNSVIPPVKFHFIACATYAFDVQIRPLGITEGKSICGTCCVNVLTCMFFCLAVLHGKQLMFIVHTVQVLASSHEVNKSVWEGV